MDCTMMMVDENTDKLGYAAHSSNCPKAFEEMLWLARECHGRTVDEYAVCTVLVNFSSSRRGNVFGSKDESQSFYRLLVSIRSDVRHKCEIFDQTAGFSFGG